MTDQVRACFDFQVRSEIDLPELPLARADGIEDAVDIRLGSTPSFLPHAASPQSGLQCQGERALLTVEGVARFLIEGVSSITVEPHPGTPHETVRLFLLGSAMGVIAMRRGMLLLHANAVNLNGRAFAFLGHSGAGKSTLAGQFAKSGYSLLSDDVCALRVMQDQAPVAWPGVARLKLWRDAADALAHPPEQRERLREGFEKYSVLTGQSPAGPVKVQTICLLDRSPISDDLVITPLTGREAMTALIQHSYRREYLAPLGLAAAHFEQCAAVARHCRIATLRRGWDLAGLKRQAERIVEELGLEPA